MFAENILLEKITHFKYDMCDKRFSQKSDLKRHILTHTKVKPHERDKKKFSLKDSLVQHFRIHLGEQPFGCTECGKWFTLWA